MLSIRFFSHSFCIRDSSEGMINLIGVACRLMFIIQSFSLSTIAYYFSNAVFPRLFLFGTGYQFNKLLFVAIAQCIKKESKLYMFQESTIATHHSIAVVIRPPFPVFHNRQISGQNNLAEPVIDILCQVGRLLI
jgi:hypothetical protein